MAEGYGIGYEFAEGYDIRNPIKGDESSRDPEEISKNSPSDEEVLSNSGQESSDTKRESEGSPVDRNNDSAEEYFEDDNVNKELLGTGNILQEKEVIEDVNMANANDKLILQTIEPFEDEEKQDPLTWLGRFEYFTDYKGQNSDVDRLKVFGMFLRGIPAIWFNHVEKDDQTFKDFVEKKFKPRFVNPSYRKWSNLEAFRNKKQGLSQSVENYILELQVLGDRVGKGNDDVIESAMRGMQQHIRQICCTKEIKTIDDLLKEAMIAQATVPLLNEKPYHVESISDLKASIASLSLSQNTLQKEVASLKEAKKIYNEEGDQRMSRQRSITPRRVSFSENERGQQSVSPPPRERDTSYQPPISPQMRQERRERSFSPSRPMDTGRPIRPPFRPRSPARVEYVYTSDPHWQQACQNE